MAYPQEDSYSESVPNSDVTHCAKSDLAIWTVCYAKVLLEFYGVFTVGQQIW